MKAARLLSLLALLIFFAAGVTQAVHASITFDEAPHLTAGYTIWRTGDYRLQPVHIHPPLANLLASLPALLLPDLPDPASIDGWEIASLSALTDTIVWQYPEPARLIFPSRVMMLSVGLLLIAVIYRWSRTIAGRRVATIAIFLLAFDPNLIAHSALVTTDTVAALTIMLTLFALSHYAKSDAGSTHGFELALFLGLCAGVAQLAKTSGTVVLPFSAVIGLIRFIKAIRNQRWQSVLGEGALILSATFITLWAGYAFQIGEFHGLHLPAAIHLRMFESFRAHYDLGHSAYALGRISDRGWLWYFPLAFAIKTPILTLVSLLMAAGMGCAQMICKKGRNVFIDQRLLLAFIAIYTATSLLSSVNIGYRHLLPLLPALCILTAKSLTHYLTSLSLSKRGNRIIGTVIIVILTIPLIRSYPYPLAFFNAFIGNRSNAAQYLSDSNLDWGQNWWELRDWQQANNAGTIRVAHYSPAHLGVYGLDATYLAPSPKANKFTPWAPEPGYYAIGATVLHGAYMADINTYTWFRNQDPDARLGNALNVYEVSTRDVPAVLIDCTYHEPDYFTQKFGASIERIIHLDCNRAEVYVDTTATQYFVDQATRPIGIANTLLVLRDVNGEIRNSLYQVSMPSPKREQNTDFDGPMDFLGYDLDTREDSLQLSTYWKVTALASRPLSLMAHLVDANGNVVAVDDGLGFPIEQWQTGDIVIQKHAFAMDDFTPSSIRTGGYWLDTMERWLTSSGDNQINLPISANH